MENMRDRTARGIALGLALLTPALLVTPAMGFDGGKGAAEVFGLTPAQLATSYSVQELSCSAPANVFWPGDEMAFTVQIVNKSDQPLAAKGRAETIAYATACDPLDGWVQFCRKVGDLGSVPVNVDIPAKGFADVVIKPTRPTRFGAYALVIDLPGQGRQFAAAFLLTPPATPGKVQHPTYALDLRECSPEMCSLWQRLGIKATRNEWGYVRTDSAAYSNQMAQLAMDCKTMAEHDITAMLCIEGGDRSTMPLGLIRSHLNEKAEGKLDYPGDFAWMPQFDPDFQKWCREIAGRFGWPNGPVNAMELWNEPWEGCSISGWGADLPRYREMYERMAVGIVEAREKDKVQVLIGGTCSSMNTEDKLFPDGKNTFLKWLDFTSIHYQPMGSVPTLIPAWMERQSPFGPVRAWDTESWFANSEDRVAPVIASMRAQGLSRTAGVLHDIIRDVQRVDIRTDDGKTKKVGVVQAWACGAGIAATQHFLGERGFRELLFKGGLPWVFVFDGLPTAKGKPNPDDGTVLVVGDLGKAYYGRNLLKYRSVQGLANAAPLEKLQRQLDTLPADAPKASRDELARAIAVAEVLDGASLTLPSVGGFLLYDYLGNPIDPVKDQLVVPLNGDGYFLRTNGKKGSFAKMLTALCQATIQGIEPVCIQAGDMTARPDRQPTVSITLANILNRPVTGTMKVSLGDLTVQAPPQPLTLAGGATTTLVVRVTGGEGREDNVYPLTVRFDAGKDGAASLSEKLHANVIARRTVAVDGKLEDWADVLPTIVTCAGDSGPNLTEKAWLPFVKFPDKAGAGLTVSYLAYDADHFYFAAKVADSTPDGGGVRFATRDDDQYYYPEVCYQSADTEHKNPLTWPAGVRRYSYRKNPDLPFSGDAVQIAFNVLPGERKGLYEYPAGTMPKFMVHADTDYEYFLHPVAARYGGGTEIWRLLAPGVPRKHFYPRQPKAEKDGGPVTSGKLAVVQDGNTRIVECALPWSELPDVKAALDAGRNIKFSLRVTDDKGPSYELAAGRSVSKQNNLAFHAYWETHWANEVEFGFEK